MALADVLSVDGGYLDIDALSPELSAWLAKGGLNGRDLEELAGNDRALRGRNDFVRLLERIDGAAIGGALLALLAHVAANRARAAREGGLRFIGVPSLEATMMGVTVVRPGDAGPHVERLQRALADLGYPARATGRYDNLTAQSVRRFQRGRIRARTRGHQRGERGAVDPASAAARGGGGRVHGLISAIVTGTGVNCREKYRYFRPITALTTMFRFVYNTGDGCCGVGDDYTGWYVDNFRVFTNACP